MATVPKPPTPFTLGGDQSRPRRGSASSDTPGGAASGLQDPSGAKAKSAGGVGPSTQGAGGGGIYRQAGAAKVLVGRAPREPDGRKFWYDVTQGRSMAPSFSVTRDDRMSASEAGAMLHAIHEMFDIATANPEVLYAFDQGLWFFHTVNGASVLNPGRATFAVEGVTVRFAYAEVLRKLGVNTRRFFRAFADDIRAANQGVLDNYDPANVVSVEHHGWLMEVAAERGLTRYPELSHDSADACTELNVGERQALMNSKRMVINATVNAADRGRNTSRVLSADSYDSTNGTSLVV